MENQHRQITGYRELSKEEIDCMNQIKELAAQAGSLIDDLQKRCPPPGAPKSQGDLDGRWVAIGKTHLQEGFMALVRSVAQPTSF